MRAKNAHNLAPRTDFGPAPKGYVPGAGRGAVGFTTRSDIGPARQAVVAADRSLTAQRERARQVLIASQQATASRNQDLSESNFDRFSGYAHSLFSVGQYDDEDEEADKIYKAIDKRMDSKRKMRREELEKKTWAEYHRKRPRPSEFFHAERTQLQSLSLDEWEAIPDAVEMSGRKRQKISSRTEKFTPLPTDIIQNGRSMGTGGLNTSGSITAYPGMRRSGLNTVMPMTMGTRTDLLGGKGSGLRTHVGGTTTSGFQTSMNSGTLTHLGGGTISDIMHLGRTRDLKLGAKLDAASDSVSGQTVVDPKGYLTDLTSFNVTSDTDLSDIQKARELLRNVIETNRTHPPGWIAAARLEESVNKIPKARKLIIQATEACADSQEVWLEAARLHGRKQARAILARAVKCIPRSPKIWIKAAMLEKEVDNKRAVLRRALEFIPDSTELWKEAVELETAEDAKIMLARAVECVPTSVEMWLALARLEDYTNAKKVINKARKKIPTDPSIWIAAAKLEEEEGRNDPRKKDNIPKLIANMVKSLKAHKVVIEREQWLEEASKCERDGSPAVCQAIVHETVGDGVDEQDRLEMWKQDAKTWLDEKGATHTARAIYAHMLKKFPKKWKIWWDAAMLEKNHGSPNNVDAVLDQAVQHCPNAVKLWLLYAKEMWRGQNDVDRARSILERAWTENSHHEDIWLAHVKLEFETKAFDRARGLLHLARQKCSTPKVWLKSAVLERSLGDRKRENQLLDEGLEYFKDFPKLWMMKAQWSCSVESRDEARKVCQEAVKYVPFSVDMWLLYARQEVDSERLHRARAVLETARSKIPKEDRLWLAACELEQTRNAQQAVLAKALLECPNSGRLWAFAVECEEHNQQRAKCVLALQKLPEDVYVQSSVAKFFWRIGKKKQAREWFERAVVNDSSIGDTWAWYCAFCKKHKTKRHVDSVTKRCSEAQPTHGKFWVKVSKDPANERLEISEILEKVVEVLPDIYSHVGKK